MHNIYLFPHHQLWKWWIPRRSKQCRTSKVLAFLQNKIWNSHFIMFQRKTKLLLDFSHFTDQDFVWNSFVQKEVSMFKEILQMTTKIFFTDQIVEKRNLKVNISSKDIRKEWCKRKTKRNYTQKQHFNAPLFSLFLN